MASVEQFLQRGEIVHCKLRPHGVVFLRPALWLGVAAALFILAPLSDQLRLWAIAGCLFVASAIVAAIEAALRRAATELAVTDRRLVLRTGLFGGTIREAFGPAIAGLEIGHDALSRRLGYAWFRIPGLGRDAKRIPLPQAELLRAKIEALALGARETAGPAIAAQEVKDDPDDTAPRQAVRTPSVRLAVLNEFDPATRRKPNGDARPKLDGQSRSLRLQPEIDRS